MRKSRSCGAVSIVTGENRKEKPGPDLEVWNKPAVRVSSPGRIRKPTRCGIEGQLGTHKEAADGEVGELTIGGRQRRNVC